MTPPEQDFGYADDGRRYRLDSRIATGGMGEVWRGTDTVLDREVAIKLLKREYADDESFRSRFETEARHAGSLHHPGIAAVFDFGEAAPADGSGAPRPYLVMELVDGQPLSDLLRPDEPMDPDVTRDLLGQAADAIGAAHAAGIVHRDIKPANLLVTPAREVKITDFGIARAAEGMALTQTGQVIGTPQYISPEQARGITATPASDVYALGVVAFECLAGRRPFVADTPIATALAHLREPVPPLPPEVPADLAAVVRKAMSKEPGDRYADGAAFAAALRDPATAATAIVPPPDTIPPSDTGSTQVLAGAAAGAAGAAGAAALDTGAAAAATTGPTHAATPPPRRRRGALWLLAGAFAVLAVVVIGFLVFAGEGDQTDPTQNPTKHPSRTNKPTKAPSSEPTQAPTTTTPTSAPPSSAPTSQAPTQSSTPSVTQSPSASATADPVAEQHRLLADVHADHDRAGVPGSADDEPLHLSQRRRHRRQPGPGAEQRRKGRPLMSNPQPTVVGGRYEVGELLGRGGMAEVRKGIDTRLGRVVAIKRLRTDLARDATFQARFRREAQSAASLNHPAIVAVYDTGEEMSTDGSDVAQPYIVMEFVAGRTLRDILREGRKILPERALEITSGVLSALDYSHRAGIIHRDIKPGNVMLTPTGDVKVMDFGIARAISDASSTMTQTAAVVGTAQYLSPEQARGETVDSRSDVYSAGCLLYELLTGRPPFVGDSPVAVAYQHVREPAAPPSDHDTDLPPEIDAIVMKALAKRLEDRYQSAAAMRSDIERYLAGRPVHAVVPPAPQATTLIPPVDAAGGHDRDTSGRAAARRGGPRRAHRDHDRPRAPAHPADRRSGVPRCRGCSSNAGRADPGPEPDRADREAGPGRDRRRRARRGHGRLPGRPGRGQGQGHQPGPEPRPVRRPRRRHRHRGVDRQAAGDGAVGGRAGQGRGRGGAAQRQAQGDAPADRLRRARGPGDLTTDPAGGASVPQGTTVTVSFSDGPEQIPDVVGMQQKDAEKAIRDAGFQPDVLESSSTTEPKGTVIKQSPQAGQTADQGSTVTILVSSLRGADASRPRPPSRRP